jgi:hypothetical protein
MGEEWWVTSGRLYNWMRQQAMELTPFVTEGSGQPMRVLCFRRLALSSWAR